MILITWNVQWCRGADGRVDPARIVRDARRIADFDVLCLQEVADNFPDPRLAGAGDDDQFARIAALLPGYTAFAGIAVDTPAGDGRRRRFGNLLVSRLPVRQTLRHQLPWPFEANLPAMPRCAIEAVVVAPWGDLRVVTTHLEYYSSVQRGVQVDALRVLYLDGYARARDSRIMRNDGGPFQTLPWPRATLIAGDFNFEPDSPDYLRLRAPLDDGVPALEDAWRSMHPGVSHPATFKLYEKLVPGEPELHCDFVFVNRECAEHLRDLRVDAATKASDHQPVVVTLE